MARQDQIDTTVNQATAAIVCAYIEHMNKALDKGLGTSTSSTAFLLESELVSLINSVQSALRTIP